MSVACLPNVIYLVSAARQSENLAAQRGNYDEKPSAIGITEWLSDGRVLLSQPHLSYLTWP